MPDHSEQSDFERRLTDELARHAEVARDPRPTGLVAAEAMRLGRRRTGHVRLLDRRLLVLAAVLIVPVALAVAGATLVRPAPDDDVRAVVVRQAGDALDVVLARPDGEERLLRRLTGENLGLGPGYVFQDAGSLGPDGWLAVFADSKESPDSRASRTVFLDLSDPANPPVILPSNGFVGPRWGPDGQAALVCGPDCDAKEDPTHVDELPTTHSVRILDLDAGTESIVPAVQLHGGTPEPIWVADGSGFLAQFGIDDWGITPLDGGQAIRAMPQIRSRHLRLVPDGAGGARLVDALEVGEAWLRGLRGPVRPLAALNVAGGESIWLLLDEPDGDEHVAVLARISGLGSIADVHRFEVPAAVTAFGFAMSDDDAFATLGLATDAPWPFVIAPLADGGGRTIVAGPRVDGLLLGLVPAAEADTWPLD